LSILGTISCAAIHDEALGGTPRPFDGINASGKGAGTGDLTGLPCDVQQLLENRCIACHQGQSPPALLTYDDLVRPSASDSSKTMAQASLERMKDASRPMPPTPAVPPTAAEVATFEAWVSAKTPKGSTCTSTADGIAPASNPYATPEVCTSNQRWTKGNDESQLMRPGGACITCHAQRGGPAFTIGGTVYPSAHEPNDCNGVSGGVTVVVTDSVGRVLNLNINAAGNFHSEQAIAPPFHVKVKSANRERAMSGSLTAGDCNSCHTATGVNGAPGRIMGP
jgi:hypothetical protein